MGVIVGAPAYNPNDKGKRLYNAAYLLYAGKIRKYGIKHCFQLTMCLMNTDILNPI
jgi:hypothetical protein